MTAGSCARILSLSVLLSSIFQWGCASHSSQTPSSSASAVSPPPLVSPPRSRRGNPPFYDVLGKRYHVLKTSDGYRERGVASWYGHDFHGLSTSSGESYDMHAMTAAHTTLPLPTWVEVTNLSNGKRVIVKVNDRGPFVNNRIIDLSYAAATALDMVRSGTTRVEVRALGVPSAEEATPMIATAGGIGAVAPTPRLSTESNEQMFVQAGAFSRRDNAVKLVDRLKASGFVNPFVVSDDLGPRTLHRVRVGPLADVQEFDRISGRLRMLGVADSHLVVER